MNNKDKNFITKQQVEPALNATDRFFVSAKQRLENEKSQNPNEEIVNAHFGPDEIHKIYGNEQFDFEYLRKLCEPENITFTVAEGVWYPNVIFTKIVVKAMR